MLPRSRRRTATPDGVRVGRGGLAVRWRSSSLAASAAPTPATSPAARPRRCSTAEALDELQQRAAEVQAGLQAQQVEVAAARDALTAAEQAVAEAQAVLADAEGELAAYQEVGRRLRLGGLPGRRRPDPLTLLLSGGDPGDVLSAMGFLDVVDAHAAEVIGDAEACAGRPGRSSSGRRALDAGPGAADEVAARVAELEAAGGRGHRRARRRPGRGRRQLAQLQAEQVDVNNRTAANWQAYVDQLTAAGVVAPPPAAARPARRAARGPGPGGRERRGSAAGAAQLPRQPTSLLVLPAETLAAVTAAMEALGLPYAPGTAGPESWDCGSLVQSVYGAAGIPLPGTRRSSSPSPRRSPPADVLPGDLVFLGYGESGLGHVGIALDPQTMLAADARAGAVVVRTLPPTRCWASAGRAWVSGPVAAPGPTGGACGWSAATPSTRRATTAPARGAATPTG